MSKDFATVLEIGSSKLKILVGKKSVNNTFNILDYAEIPYDGYYEGEFIDFDKFKTVITDLFEKIDYKRKKYNKKLYVGLPAEFICVEVANAEISFDRNRKVKKSDIQQLNNQASSMKSNEDVEIITATPISYFIDGGSRLISDPIGRKTNQIRAEISVILSDKNIINKLNNLFSTLGFEAVEYTSETLAQAMMVIPKDDRENLCLMIDVGYLSTSVSFIKGDGIVSLSSFQLGGGYITGDLSEKLGISFKDAEKLQKTMIISIKGARGDFYDIITDNGVERVPLQEANNIAIDRIFEIGKAVNQCMQLYADEYINFLPVYLTGCALSKLKGGRDYLSKCIGRNINLGVPSMPGKDKPENSAILGLLNYALKDEEN